MTVFRPAIASSLAMQARSPHDSKVEDLPSVQTDAERCSSEDDLPGLVMLLADPEVRLIMDADRIDAHELLSTLQAVSVQLRDRSRPEQQTAKPTKEPAKRRPAKAYRPGVGVMLLNERNEIFIGRRIDIMQDAWQMPQGGIDRGETPRRAALRELKEEIGIDRVEVIAESNRWFYYDVPDEFAQKAWRGRWRGQRQKWFVMLLKGPDTDINLATEHPEFNAWRWASLAELSALAVSFKQQIYLDVLGEFSTLFRD
jgi:putative (di)nucleoside polyphosphate hydrolase